MHSISIFATGTINKCTCDTDTTSHTFQHTTKINSTPIPGRLIKFCRYLLSTFNCASRCISWVFPLFAARGRLGLCTENELSLDGAPLLPFRGFGVVVVVVAGDLGSDFSEPKTVEMLQVLGLAESSTVSPSSSPMWLRLSVREFVFLGTGTEVPVM